MGRTPCCDKKGLKKGPWTSEEDELLVNFIKKNGGHGSWRSLPKLAGLVRCGKSCRLRWTNYLRPDIKRGPFTAHEENLVIQLHAILGNRWAAIASQIEGRTDNEIKNLWNTHLKKRLLCMGVDPLTHKPLAIITSSSSSSDDVCMHMRHMAQWESARLQAEARLSRDKHSSSSDMFLRLWNSEVGLSFRSPIHSTCIDPAASSAPPPPPTMPPTHSHDDFLDDSSSDDDTAFHLLLDFPIDHSNDISFLSSPILPTYHQP